MRLNCSRLSLALSFLLPAVACVPAPAQTDLALSVYGAFGSTVGNSFNSVSDSPSDSAGGMIELRHIRNPFVGYEATYSFNRANQVYNALCTFCSPVAVSANAHGITGDWLFSAHAGKLRPFALVGVGLLLNEPTSGQSYTQSSNTAVYVYGAGLDWRLFPHLGLRFQYRGNVHRAPHVTTAYSPTTDAFAHTAEPMIGAYFKF